MHLSLYAGKKKCCISRVKNVEIHFAKIGSVDFKCSNLNAPGSYNPWFHSLGVSLSLDVRVHVPFRGSALKSEGPMVPLQGPLHFEQIYIQRGV